MEKNKFEEIINNLNFNKNYWYDFEEISSIVLKNGIGIYPNWMFMKFLILENNNILIKHGKPIPYGDRLSNINSLAYDGLSISFPTDKILSPSKFPFRLPKNGDIICSTDGNKLLSESFIINVRASSNMFFIKVSSPIKMGKLSFYDPILRKSNGNHSEIEGNYINFLENKGKLHKKFGVYHEVINYKNIEEINLKLNTKKLYKTYTIK